MRQVGRTAWRQTGAGAIAGIVPVAFDYGVAVHVSVPPREEVVPSSELHGTAIASTCVRHRGASKCEYAG
jgi:hypothetical protein